MISANGNSSLRTENSVFLAPESPFYLLCVIFSLLHFFSVDGPKNGGGHGPSGPMVNTPLTGWLIKYEVYSQQVQNIKKKRKEEQRNTLSKQEKRTA